VLEEEVAEEILRRANRSENGARMLESVIDGALLPPVSLQLLQRLSAGEPIKRVRFSVSERQFVAEVEG
jgi:type VI secretion system protein VasG